MKTIFLIGFIILSIKMYYSQSYYPLIKNNKYWDIFDGDGTQICDLLSGGRYFFDGDTSISGNQYRVLKRYPIIATQPGPYCPPFAIDSSYSGIAAFLREDTLQKKVYQFDLMYNEEDLLYDFSLNGGDTLLTNHAGDGTILIVDSVTDITILNGEQRKLFWLNNGQYYIESIGHNNLYGLLLEGIGFWREVHCVLDNGVHLYGNQCYSYVGVYELPFYEDVFFYPNPTTGKITINAKEFESVEIINIEGKQIYNGKKTEINLSSQRKGIYIVKVKTNKAVVVEKIVLE